MFQLTSKLALSNLVKNRHLYYPFALTLILATSILYSFVALAHGPNMEASYGGTAARTTLRLGIYIVQLALLILVVYGNSFVMKNRWRELGLYRILGMEKKHLLLMTLWELILLYLVILGLGLLWGISMESVLYHFLLKLIDMPLAISSLFQWSNLLWPIFSLGLAFVLILGLNSLRIVNYSSLNLLRESRVGEKEGRFLGLQSLLGLILLSTAYFIALRITHPVSALPNFFLAVLLVIMASFLLFNAGTISFLKFLKSRPSYYKKASNLIAYSNLISRMRKNAAGLATISLLSTMLLVTLTGSINIYIGNKDYLDTLYPHAYNLVRSQEKAEADPQILDKVTELAKKHGLKDIQIKSYLSQSQPILQTGKNQFKEPTSKKGGENLGDLLLISRQDYEKMTGNKLTLKDHEVLVYQEGFQLSQGQKLKLAGKDWTVKQILNQDFSHGQLSNPNKISFSKHLYLVVNRPASLQLKGGKSHYLGLETKDKQNQAFLQDLYQDLGTYLGQGQDDKSLVLTMRSEVEKVSKETVGTLLFIGIFLSFIFLVATVLVIYYKQISEGYEDRQNFIILEKVGLDKQEVRKTIGKQILTVFFLPLCFAFLHVAAAFKMLTLILKILGVTNLGLLIQTSLGIALIFFLIYISVFSLTSRSYQRIVSR